MIEYEISDGRLNFPSSVVTNIPKNNVVHAKVSPAGDGTKSAILFHHWNARSRQSLLANFLGKYGITVVEVDMPYHFNRCRPDATYADHMLGPNLGRTLQSMKQAVLDGRGIVDVLTREGFVDISVIGMSLGSWAAGLVAAHDQKVKRASLFLTGDSLAEMVWTGRATRHIRQSLEGMVPLSELERIWSPLNLDNFVNELSRNDLKIQMIIAKRDKVVLPCLSERLAVRLAEARANLSVHRLNCGHYSLTLPPYILSAGWRLKNFLAE